MARSQRAEAPFNEKQPPAKRPPPQPSPAQPSPGPTGAAGRSRARPPAAGAAAHRPVSAGEAAWLPPSPWHTNARVCVRVRACVRVCVCARQPARLCVRARSAREAPAAAMAERGPCSGRGGGGCLGLFWERVWRRVVCSLPLWSCPAEEAEGGDGERAGAERGRGQTDGAPGAAPSGGGHRGSREPAAGRGAERPAEPG